MLHFADPSADHAIPMQRARGAGRIAAKARGKTSALDTLFQEGCGKIRVPKSQGDWLDAVLINSSGGLTGGDILSWDAHAGPGTHLVVTSQACERIYRAVSGAAKITTRLEIGAGARLDWLPQETILFNGSALERSLEVDLAEDATFLGLETVILGRHAHGEDGFSAAIAENWRIRRAGALVHAEASNLSGGDGIARTHMSLLDGAGAYGTLCYLAPDAERRIEAVKALLAQHPTAGASRIGDKIVVRALAPSGYQLRRIIMPIIAALSGAGAVPKLWSL